MSDELDQARASIEHLRGDVAKLRAERDRAQADCDMHMQHRMEIERLLDGELGPEVEDSADAGFVADVALALQRRKAERDTALAELAALRASAVVPPVGGWEHLVWHAVYNGDPYANVVALIKSWRPATVEAAPTPAEARTRECTCGAGGTLARGHARTCPVRQKFDSRDLGPAIHGLGEPAYFCVDDAAGVSGTGTEASDGE